MKIIKGKIPTDCGISPLTAMLHQKDGIQDVGHAGFPKKLREKRFGLGVNARISLGFSQLICTART